MLMRYMKADKLKEKIPSLDYDQKIEVLKNLVSILNYYYPFCYLSINNVYISKKLKVKLLDCMFDADYPHLAPETKDLSLIRAKERITIDVYSVGVIAYEMFGGVFDSKKEFNFDNFPVFIEKIIKLCCMKNHYDRADLKFLKTILKYYADPISTKMIQSQEILVSPYYIEPNDLIAAKVGHDSEFVIQKSSKKLLVAKYIGWDYETFVNKIRPYIRSSRIRNCIPIYGFSYYDQSFQVFYEHFDDISKYEKIDYANLDDDVKLDAFRKLFQIMSDLNDLNMEIEKYKTILDIDKNAKFYLECEYLIFKETTNKRKDIYLKRKLDEMIDNFRDKEKCVYDQDIFKEAPLLIQAIFWRVNVFIIKEKASLSQVCKVFDGMNKKISSDVEIRWDETCGTLNDGDEFLIYRSTCQSDLIEESIRVEILMETSNLFSYKRSGNDFALIYHGKAEESFISYLNTIEYHSMDEIKIKRKIRNCSVDHEYQGKHCLVQFLVDGEKNKRYVKKKYPKTSYEVMRSRYYDLFVRSFAWEEENCLYIVQELKGIETLEECISKSPEYLNDDLKTEIIKEVIYILYSDLNDYGRHNPHNICLAKSEYKKIKIVDTIKLDSDNYEEFKDGYMAPECSKFAELDDKEKDDARVYSAGWIAYVLFGQTPELDERTNRFKPPTFSDDFPKFWKDFVLLTTRENPIDRPLCESLVYMIDYGISFDETDFVYISSKLLDHNDFILEEPYGSDGDSSVYLATNKVTEERHSCIKLKHKLRSQEVKKIIFHFDKHDNLNYGIRYSGLSVDKETVFLHIDQAFSCSVSDLLALDRMMKPPTWFDESAKLQIANEIAKGMETLHEQGIIHKLLRPENIMIDEKQSVKICSFSTIQDYGTESPLYMAPELINGEDHSFKSDVFSFGLILSCLYGGSSIYVPEATSNLISAINGVFHPSISVNTPSSIKNIIKKCLSTKPETRPSFSEIVDELDLVDLDDDELKVKSMSDFPSFDPNIRKGILSDKLEYEICDITDNAAKVEHQVRLHMTIQPENMLQIHKYCVIDKKIILIIERSNRTSLEEYLMKKQKVSHTKGDKYGSDFISVFELYHRNGFYFGPLSMKRFFFRDGHYSTICFDLFMIKGLSRPETNDEALFSIPEGIYSQESDIYSFGCFVLKIFNCYSINSNGIVQSKPFRSMSPLTSRFRRKVMVNTLNSNPQRRTKFDLLFKELYPIQYDVIKNYLSVSVSRFTAFSLDNSLDEEKIIIKKELGSGSFGKVAYAVYSETSEEIAIKEFNDLMPKNSMDFMLEYVVLKSINHPNIVKILGASPSKKSSKTDSSGKDLSHGSRLYMEFANKGDLRNNIHEPFEQFVINLLQISSAMKYLHQRGTIHLNLKPENILIRKDGSAVVADFNTAMHVEPDAVCLLKRGSENYMSPEILNGEKYSFSTDVFSFGMMAAEYFSSDALKIIREANLKHEKPVLDFISDEKMRLLLEFCVDDDPMIRPSFDIICNYIYKNFIKDKKIDNDLEKLTKIPKMEEEKLNQLRIVASQGSIEAILEYGKYLLSENMISDALQVYSLGANQGNARCQNTLGVLLKMKVFNKTSENPDDLIRKAAENGDYFAMTNYGYYLSQVKGHQEDAINLLSSAYANKISYAGYLLGLIYENNEIEGMTLKERINKAIEYYKEVANDGDGFAQFKYGLFLENGTTTDESGNDCLYYFRKSAYQRCRSGVAKYNQYIKGEREEYYTSLEYWLPQIENDIHYIWTEQQMLFDEMMAYSTGVILLDSDSKDKFNFLLKSFFSNKYWE